MLHACYLLFILCLCMSVKSSTELMLYVVLTMPTLNKAYLLFIYLFTQFNANTDLNFRLKFSKTTWPTETIYISFKSLFKDKFIDI